MQPALSANSISSGVICWSNHPCPYSTQDSTIWWTDSHGKVRMILVLLLISWTSTCRKQIEAISSQNSIYTHSSNFFSWEFVDFIFKLRCAVGVYNNTHKLKRKKKWRSCSCRFKLFASSEIYVYKYIPHHIIWSALS